MIFFGNETIYSSNITDAIFYYYIGKVLSIIEIILWSLTNILTFITNGFLLLAIYKVKNLHTIPVVFIANLAITDILKAIVEYSPIIMEFIIGPFLYNNVTLGKLHGLFCVVSGIISLFTMCFLSINRYLMIVMPQHYPIIFNKNSVIVILLSLWIGTIIVSSAPFFGLGKYGFYLEILCYLIKVDYYAACLYILIYPLPTMIIVYCNYKIVLVVKQSRMRARRPNNDTRETIDKNKIIDTRREKEIQLARTLFAIVLAYFCLYGPLLIAGLPYVLISQGVVLLPRWVAAICQDIWIASSFINPILYYFTNRDFKNAIHQICPYIGKIRFTGSISPSI